MDKLQKKQLKKLRRKNRVQVTGTTERPRLTVFRSLRSIYAQVIDDSQGVTLAAAKSKDLGESQLKGKNKTEIAMEVGKLLASRAQEKGVSSVVFDKGSFLYHGRVKALADGAREGGLQF